MHAANKIATEFSPLLRRCDGRAAPLPIPLRGSALVTGLIRCTPAAQSKAARPTTGEG